MQKAPKSKGKDEGEWLKSLSEKKFREVWVDWYLLAIKNFVNETRKRLNELEDKNAKSTTD